MNTFWRKPQLPYKPGSPTPVSPTKMETVSFHSDLVGRALYTHSLVEQELEEFKDEHNLDVNDEKVREERNRLFNEKYKDKEFVDLDDDADYDPCEISIVKHFTIQDTN